jgi:hypothetical protein
MTYQYARINLANTTYTSDVNWKYITSREPDVLHQLDTIYRSYCIYKKFPSVMPMFHSRYTDPMADIIGYYDQDQLVAWSLIRRFDLQNAICDQFAWNYHYPKMRLGMHSLQTECAIYRDRGFKYLYLDQAHLYKQSIQGYELLKAMQ